MTGPAGPAVLHDPAGRRGLPPRRSGRALAGDPAARGRPLSLAGQRLPAARRSPAVLVGAASSMSGSGSERSGSGCATPKFQDPVYKDSCVEFFVDAFPDPGRGYVNFETNAAGTLLAAFGPDRSHREAALARGPGRVRGASSIGGTGRRRARRPGLDARVSGPSRRSSGSSTAGRSCPATGPRPISTSAATRPRSRITGPGARSRRRRPISTGRSSSARSFSDDMMSGSGTAGSGRRSWPAAVLALELPAGSRRPGRRRVDSLGRTVTSPGTRRGSSPSSRRSPGSSSPSGRGTGSSGIDFFSAIMTTCSPSSSPQRPTPPRRLEPGPGAQLRAGPPPPARHRLRLSVGIPHGRVDREEARACRSSPWPRWAGSTPCSGRSPTLGRILGREERAAAARAFFEERLGPLRRTGLAGSDGKDRPSVYLRFWGSLVRTPVVLRSRRQRPAAATSRPASCPIISARPGRPFRVETAPRLGPRGHPRPGQLSAGRETGDRRGHPPGPPAGLGPGGPGGPRPLHVRLLVLVGPGPRPRRDGLPRAGSSIPRTSRLPAWPRRPSQFSRNSTASTGPSRPSAAS